MAKTQYLNLEGLTKYDELLKALIGIDKIPSTATQKTVVEYLAAQISNSEFSGNAEDVTLTAITGLTATDVQDAIEELLESINTLNGGATEDGSVAKAIADAMGELKIGSTTYTTAKAYIDALVVGVKNLFDKTTGDLTNLATSNRDDVVSAINEVNTAIGVEAKAETVPGAGDAVVATGLYKYIDDAVAAVDSTTANAISIKTDSTSTGMLKSYTIYQGGEADANKIGVIDIPKDLVVSSGEVVKDPAGQAAGTYIKLVIANQTNPLYINVKDLVDVYTAQASATQVQLAVSTTNEISANIVAKSITKTELADALKNEIESATTAIGVASQAESAPGAGDAVVGTGLTKRIEDLEGLTGEGIEAIPTTEITKLFSK